MTYFVMYRWFSRGNKPKVEYYFKNSYSHSYAYHELLGENREGGVGNCSVNRDKPIIGMDDIIDMQHRIECSTKWPEKIQGKVQVIITGWQLFELQDIK